MKTIDKLLDEYGKVNRIYGAALEGPIPSPECDKWFISVTISRAAVDAKIKEMQDRVEELEATLTSEYVRSNEHVDRMEIYTEQIIQHKEAEVRSLESRIAELERENGEMRDKLNNPFYGVELYVREGR